MIGNSARPGGSLGEMLHQLREQAEGAASRVLLQVLAAAIGTKRTTETICYLSAFGQQRTNMLAWLRPHRS
jgi:hypothetical protein